MTYSVSVTSQGQITLPALLRRSVGLDKKQKALVTLDKGRLIVERVPDFIQLAGVFKSKKKVPFRQTRRTFEHYLGTRHLGNKLT